MEVASNLLLFVFGTVGMTSIIVEGEIFRPVKEKIKPFMPAFFFKLLDCYQCSGFWCGILMGLLLFVDYNIIFYSGNIILSLWELRYVFISGCASSCLSYYFANKMTYLEANSIVNPK
jgi:hypothetical protein